MKYIFCFFIVVLGLAACADNAKSSLLSSKFLETQLEASKTSLKSKMLGDEKKAGPTYFHAKLLNDKCEEVILSVKSSEKPTVVKENLRNLKKSLREGLGILDTVLLKNAEIAIEELILQPDYSNSEEVIYQLNLINYSFWTCFNESIDKHDYVFDWIDVVVANQNGKEGALFQTELFPVPSSSTRNIIVRIGSGYDSTNHLIGIIDTLKRNESRFTVYKVENARKGIYDIPAEIISPAAGGMSVRKNFYIHYEIK